MDLGPNIVIPTLPLTVLTSLFRRVKGSKDILRAFEWRGGQRGKVHFRSSILIPANLEWRGQLRVQKASIPKVFSFPTSETPKVFSLLVLLDSLEPLENTKYIRFNSSAFFCLKTLMKNEMRSSVRMMYTPTKNGKAAAQECL